MRFKFLGTRGSYPTSIKANQKFGGSTPCLEVESKGYRLILDAGTGILNLDFDFYNKVERLDILLTHLHMDHIQGLGFFKPLFIPHKEVHIWGPRGSADSLRVRLNRFLSPPIFPIPLRDLRSNLVIHEIGQKSFKIGPFNIKSRFIIHPGPTLGYKLESEGQSLTYMPDHEPMIGPKELYKEDKWISGFPLCKNTDVLIHDAQYTDVEYPGKVGWGHSSLSQVLNLSQRAKVKKLFLFHHDPGHSDSDLKSMLETIRNQNSRDKLKIKMATQGKSYTI